MERQNRLLAPTQSILGYCKDPPGTTQSKLNKAKGGIKDDTQLSPDSGLVRLMKSALTSWGPFGGFHTALDPTRGYSRII